MGSIREREDMHVLQFIAVEAEDKDNAFNIVKNNLESETSCTWSDWHVVGGGRWGLEEFEKTGDSYTDTSSTVISFAEEPELFIKYLAISEDNRIQEFERNKKELSSGISALEYMSDNYNPSEEGYDFDNLSKVYSVERVIRVIIDEWDCNSYFFDITNWTTKFAPTKKAMLDEDTSNKLYLVPVDFHF